VPRGLPAGLPLQRGDLTLPPSDLPHGLDLPRLKVEPRPGFTVPTCPSPEAQPPLTVNLGALDEPMRTGTTKESLSNCQTAFEAWGRP
jgi:hypothetical protein